MFNVRRMGSVMYFQFKTCWHSPRFIWVISTWGGGCSSEILPFLDGSNMGASSAHSMVQKVECGANTCWLVVWNIFLFFHILGIVTPTDFHIFRGVAQPPTSMLTRTMKLWGVLRNPPRWNPTNPGTSQLYVPSIYWSCICICTYI